LSGFSQWRWKQAEDYMHIRTVIWQLSNRPYQGKAGRMMNKRIAFTLAGCVALLCGCEPVSTSGGSADDSTSIAGMKIGAPFTLTDQDGRKVRWDDFRGKYRLVYFGYTYCPDVCPIDLQHITQGVAAFGKAAPERAGRLATIFITVDPARDTPTALKSYVAAFKPSPVGLTGTEAEIAAVAKSFAVVYGKEKGNSPADYLVMHTRTPFLFGPDGAPIALVPVDDPATSAQEGLPARILAFLQARIT
jgi:protein SCO1